MFSRRSSRWAAVIALAMVYFVAGKLGLRLAFLQPSASPVWPPAGIALAALLLLGISAWPGIFLGAFFVNLTTAGNLATSLCIATGNTFEALCGAWLVNRFAGGTRVFGRAQDVFKFVLIAVVSTAVSPSIGLTSLALGHFARWDNYHAVWLTWWLGDMTGYIIFAPLVLQWWVGPRLEWTARRKAEAGVLLLLLIVVGGTVFGGWFASFTSNYPIAFVCGPVIFWTAFRFTQRETATGIFILASIALWGTLHHYGPYQLRTDNQSLLTLQCWAGVMTLTSMTLAAAMAERRRVEAELEQQKAAVESANRTKDNFLAMLSHELRTPLTPVVASLDLLESEPGQTEEMRGTLAAIRRNIELERRLIDDLLDLTRVARGKLKLELKSLDAHETIAHVVEICRSDAAEKKLRLALDPRAVDFHVAADAAKFPQIIWNLLKNAIKFTPEKGEIIVSTANEEPGCLTITVRDNGIGIEPEVMRRVFDAFEQGDRSSQGGHGGLGLGLAISKAIAEGHGGTLTASSAGRDRGAAFGLTMKTAPPPAIPPRPGPERDGKARRHWRILLVDDHADTCATLARLLSRRGHKVATAYDTRTATEVAQREAFDLLVSDVGLPDGSGMGLMTQLRASYGVRGIAISGFGMNDDVARSLAAGFSEHLVKPVSLDKLEAAIERAMRER